MQSLNDKYISIQGWMVEELKLKGNDLLVYAIIYGFSQDNESEFTGSLSYLATWCNSTKNGIQKNLKKLIDAKLISKKSTIKNGVKYCSYSCTPYNRVVQGIQQSCTGYTTELHGGIQQSCNNNIDINNRNKTIEDNIDKKNSKKKSKIDTKIESIEKKCLEYDLEDEVIELLSRFFRNLLENHKMVTDDKINAILIKLAKVNTKTQINAIQLSLDNGYMNIDPEWLQNKNNSYNGNGKCSKELAWRTHEEMQEAEKKRQEFIDAVKRNDPSLHKF